MERLMPVLTWKAELGTAHDIAFSAQLGRLITYHVISRSSGYPAYVEVLGRHASLKRLDLGCHESVQQAKRVCELHCAAGCNLSNAKKIAH
jgi:hypothetical protein